VCVPGEERWLPAAGYAGWYEVSCCGNVWSLARPATPGGLLTPQLNSAGYRFVRLHKYGRVQSVTVGSLVLATFRPVGSSGRRARHGPGGKTDDSLPNLSWG
jgi:NUMOD4 motif